MAVSPESISASVPSNTALATSLTSARVGDGAVIIDSNICVAVITGTPASTQWRTIRFCRWGTSSIGQSMPRSPRATITTSLAATISCSWSMAGGGLDLGHQQRPIADDRSDLVDVGGRPDERHGDELDTRRSHGLGQHEILAGRRRQSEPLRRQVDARATIGLAPVLQLRDDRVDADLGDPHRDRTVAELHPTADDEVLDQRGIGDGDVVDVAGALPGSERDELAGDEPHPSVGEGPGADLRAGQIGQHGDRSPAILCDVADPRESLEVLVERRRDSG